LPVVNAILARLGFEELVVRSLPKPDPRSRITSTKAIGVLVRHLALGRRPLYGLSAWSGGCDAALLGLGDGEARLLNDDRMGRALDELLSSDRAGLLTTLSLAAIRRFGIEVTELHNDSTSITLYGAYRQATDTPRAGVRPPVPERGFSKDHRCDLLQLVEILTVSADGAVPIAHRLADGSTEDSTTHISTWDQLVAMVGTAAFTYVADSKLAARDNLDHIAHNGGWFLTILPKTRKEDGIGRAQIAGGELCWAEIVRRPGKRQDDPDRAYLAAEAPTPSVEVEHRQERRGRPGKNTYYRRIEHHRFSLIVTVDAEAVTLDAASDGCFPFITNHDLAPGELLRIYKAQPHLERRHATFKGVAESLRRHRSP
jgi:hypothetical protein